MKTKTPPKGKPRGRSGGRKPLGEAAGTRRSLRLPPDLWEYLDERGNASGTIREAINLHRLAVEGGALLDTIENPGPCAPAPIEKLDKRVKEVFARAAAVRKSYERNMRK